MMLMLCVFMSLLWLPCTSFVIHSSSRFSLSLIPCSVVHKGVSSLQLQEGVLSQFDVEGLESRSRAELQQLAKEHGLKANARSVDIIDRLKAIHASSSSTDDEDDDDDDPTVLRPEASSAYQSGNMDSNAEHDDALPQDNQSNDPSSYEVTEVDDRISRVLASQGLSWSDILQLQHQFYEDPDGIAPKDELSAAEDDTEVDTDIATEFYRDDDGDKNQHDEVNKGNRKTRVVHSAPTDRFTSRSKLVVKPIVDNASSSRKRPSNDRTSHLEIGATVSSTTSNTAASMMMSTLEQPLRSGVDVSDITTRPGKN